MLKEIRIWTAERPLTVSAVLLLMALVYFVAPVVYNDPTNLFGHGRQEQGAEDFATSLWPELCLAGVLLAIVVLIGWVRSTCLTTRLHIGPIFLAVPYILFVIFIASSPALLALSQDREIILTPAEWQVVWVACLAAFLVGFFEELLFRGVLLHGLRARMAAVPAVLVAAVIFGSFHFVNWVNGQPLDATVAQVSGAAGGGVFYGAMVLWTGSIWPSVMLHGLWDSGVTISQTLAAKSPVVSDQVPDTDANASAGLSLWEALLSPEMIYGLLLLFAWWLWSGRRKKAKTA
ncbi:CPBP family intramembrane glutamic endopeptidase [uncultured Tateyamaria sp.]|uniref:CPBP family intramembrane glutamic endopeptidase n=1 Tax=uncultured Tateyamaria sp. TaxID=455651 RepID=UPI0026278082|nr:CPBP family intramembrane glutamic endopeptidase [uncultured Tateyamaria sp.]